MSVNIDVSGEQLKRAQDLLAHIPGAMPKAMARAINKAISAANTEATKQIQGHYIIRNKKVIVGAKAIKKKATKGSLSASLQAEGSPIPLGAFLTNPKKATKRRMKNLLFAKVKIDGGGEIKGAFLATVQTGHIGIRHAGVFIRTGKYGRRGNEKLEKIKQLYGPSVPQMLGGKEVSAFIEERAKIVFDKRLDHEIDVILRGVVK